MVWGTVELEPEVVKWLEALPDDQFGLVEFYIDRLADRGVELGEPYTRHLGGKLRQLRFHLGPSGDAVRISYYIATGRRIIPLTVFRKLRQREKRRRWNGAGGRWRKASPKDTRWRAQMSEQRSWGEVKAAVLMSLDWSGPRRCSS